MPVGGRQCRMSNPRGGNRAGTHAGRRRQILRGDQFVTARACAILPQRLLRDADDAGACLYAGHDRRHGASRIRRLLIGFIGAAERAERELLEALPIAFTIHALELAGHDACGGDRRQAHAVAEKHDHVLYVLSIGMRLIVGPHRLRRATAKPPCVIPMTVALASENGSRDSPPRPHDIEPGLRSVALQTSHASPRWCPGIFIGTTSSRHQRKSSIALSRSGGAPCCA